MKSEKIEAISFLSKYGMYHGDIDFIVEVDKFVDEMERGLAGQGSLQMIPTYLGLDNLQYSDENVIVIDAGGTNFRVALGRFNERQAPVFDEYAAYKMPGADGARISSDELFRQMADLVRPLSGKAERIGFCFSYPTDILSNRDGRVVRMTKGLDIVGCEGELVGENLLAKLDAGPKRVSILNDTVATLLGGVAAHRDRKFSSYCGMVLGTGYNMAYIEKAGNIIKDSEIAKSGGSMIINIEAGNYARAIRGEIDKIFNAKDKDPGVQTFEKMISGAYLGGMVLEVLKKAAEDGLFSVGFRKAIVDRVAPDSALLDEFLYRPDGDSFFAGLCADERDRLLVYYSISELLERTAKFVAIGIAAVVKKTGEGSNPLAPALFLAEGSTFYKSKTLKDRISAYIHKYLEREMGLYCEILGAGEVTFAGSLIAGLI